MPEYLPPEVASILDVVDSYLVWQQKNQPPRGHEKYHPSAFGKCLRLMQYQRYEERGLVKGDHKDFEPFICRVFGNGHSMHDRWRSYFEGLGILRGYWVCTNPTCALWDDNGNAKAYDLNEIKNCWGDLVSNRRVYGKDNLQGCFKPEKCVCGWEKFHYEEIDVVDEELNFAGHADMILDFSRFDSSKFASVSNLFNIDNLPTKPIVVDMKTINHFQYQDVAKGVPNEEYVVQLTIYANILDCDYGVLIYENKNNQKTCAFRIDKRAEDIFPLIKHQARLMNDMVAVEQEDGQVVNLLPPPRPSSKDSKDCEYCSYRTICHQSDVWDQPDFHQMRKDFYGELL